MGWNPYPKFSWSNSRKKRFDDCQRAYYYQYYSSNGASKESTEVTSWRENHYKKMLPMKLAFAESLQLAATYFVEKPKEITELRFRSIMLGKLRSLCSVRLKDWEDNPKKNPCIMEILNYEGGYKNPEVVAISDSIKANYDGIIKNFFQSPTALEIKGGAEVKECFDSNNDTGWFLFRGNKETIKIWGKPDIVHVTADGKYIATTLKTNTSGNASEHCDEQLGANIIALYVASHYKQDYKNVEVRMANLIAGETRAYSIRTTDECRDAYKKAFASIKDMMGFLENGDIGQNKPLPIEKFSMKENDEGCRQCRFFGACRGKKEVEARWARLREPKTNTNH